MRIRPAAAEDLAALEHLFERARAFMAATGNPNQWPASYPGAALIRTEIARGVCYILEHGGRPEATFCYIPGLEPTYARIYDGEWPDDAPYATIHRMASAGRIHGAAAACFAWCAAQGLPLRADTHQENHVMQHLLEKNGFCRCGSILLLDGRPRIAYFRPAEERVFSRHTPAQSAALAAAAVRALPRPLSQPLLVALDGRCAAGKTTIAAQLAQKYGWGVVHLDDFFLQPAQRTEQRLAEPGGNLDRERLIREVLLPLSRGADGSYRVFRCAGQDFSPVCRPLPTAPVVVLEGSYACHPDLWPFCGLHLFADISQTEQLNRLALRNRAALDTFRTRWIPMEELYLAHFGIRERCDAVI